jgi:hypothetical protein
MAEKPSRPCFAQYARVADGQSIKSVYCQGVPK